MEPQVNNPGPGVNSPTSPQPMQPQQAQPSNRRKWLLMLLALLLIVLAAGGVYAWQHKKVNDLNNQIMTLQADNYQLRYELTDLRSRL